MKKIFFKRHTILILFIAVFISIISFAVYRYKILFNHTKIVAHSKLEKEYGLVFLKSARELFSMKTIYESSNRNPFFLYQIYDDTSASYKYSVLMYKYDNGVDEKLDIDTMLKFNLNSTTSYLVENKKLYNKIITDYDIVYNINNIVKFGKIYIDMDGKKENVIYANDSIIIFNIMAHCITIKYSQNDNPDFIIKPSKTKNEQLFSFAFIKKRQQLYVMILSRNYFGFKYDERLLYKLLIKN
ncbi:MAG: hypothetical protein RJA07_680 [Bacteroidota bacterium]|jgi:hypothetical protein